MLLARDQCKGSRDISDYKLRLDGGSGERLIRLDAILCLTEYIERDSDVESNDVIATWSDNYLQLTLISVEYPAVELWQAERNILEPLQGPFGRSVSFDSFAPLD